MKNLVWKSSLLSGAERVSQYGYSQSKQKKTIIL